MIRFLERNGYEETAITLMGYVVMEMEEKTYSYPISNFKFDDN